MACIVWYDGESLTASGFPLGGSSLAVTQDCVIGEIHHGGALALRGRFWPKINCICLVVLGTKPTYEKPLFLFVSGFACLMVLTGRC